MKHLMLIGTVAVLLMLLTMNCARKPEPSVPVDAPTMSLQQSPASGGKAEWETRWEKTLLAARKEGELMVYASNMPPEARIIITDVLDKKFGIKMDTLVAPSPDLRARIHSEYRAGVYQVDVYLGGAGGIILVTKPLGYLSPLEPALILPEVKDPKAWLGGKSPFFDQDGTVFSWLAISSPSIIYNTNLVKKGEIGSYLDLLKPQWKEKIIMSYPSAGGGAAGGMGGLVEEWGLDKAKEYLRYMVNEQKAVVTRNQYQTAEWVARGKVPIGLFSTTAPVVQFVIEGAPLATPLTKEPKRMLGSNGNVAVLTRSPHPNATIVFANWLLSREGQAVAARTYGAPSARADVPAEGVPEIVRAISGQKYVFENEERTMRADEFINEWKIILGQ